MEHISRLTICYGYSIHTQAKAQMLRPPDCFLQIYKSGQYRNAFLVNAYSSLVSRCKFTKKIRIPSRLDKNITECSICQRFILR